MSRECFGRFGLRYSVAAAALMAFVAPVAVHAQEASYSFNIPSQDMASALKAFGRASGRQLAFDAQAVAGKTAPAVNGRMTAAEALNHLLAGSGLEAQQGSAGEFVIRTRAAVQAQTSTKVDEVIVTASKRPEKLQDVAGSVSAQTGAQLEQHHAESLTDYAQYIPGLDVASVGSTGYAGVSLRGISPLGESSTVGVYLDETPIGSSINWTNAQQQILDVLPYDLDRLEVLRGPQGTLYGASTLGGLIKYVLKNPSLTTYDAVVGSDVFTTDHAKTLGYSIRAAADMPLIQDQLGLRVSVFDKYTPGFIDNVQTGDKGTNWGRETGGRVALLWRPTQDLSIKVNALQMTTTAGDGAAESFTNGVTTMAPDGTVIETPGGYIGRYEESHAFASTFRKNLTYLSSTIDLKAGPFDLVSATGWSRSGTQRTSDATQSFGGLLGLFGDPGGLAKAVDHDGTQRFTQEFRVSSSKDQPVSWLVGAYYANERSYENERYDTFTSAYAPFPVFGGPSYLINILSPLSFQEYAVFGDATWKVTDRFDITGGLRYATNRQTIIFESAGALVPNGTITQPALTQNETTWSVDSRYHFSSDVMVYARVATGYRPGGFNNPLLFGHVPPTYKADTTTNYEAGLKAQFLDRKVLFDISAFWIDWKDIQITGAFPGNSFTYVGNAGKAVSRGFELTSSYAPTENLKLGFNAAYTKADITHETAGGVYSTGYQLPDVPKLSWTATADYDWALANDWRAHVGGAVRWNDKEWTNAAEFGPGAFPTNEAPAYTVVNLNADVSNGRWTLKAFATNLTNQRTPLATLFWFPSAAGDSLVMTPRTLGLGLDLAF